MQEISQEEWEGMDAAVSPPTGAQEISEEEWANEMVPAVEPQDDPGVWGRYKQDIGKHGLKILMRQGVPMATIFGASAGVRAIGDALVTGALGAYDMVDDYLPEDVRESIANGAGTAAEYIEKADSAVKRALEWAGLDETNQRILGAAFDIAALGPGPKGSVMRAFKRAERGPIAQKAEQLRRSGTAQRIARNKQKIMERIAPDRVEDLPKGAERAPGGPPLSQTKLNVLEGSNLDQQAHYLAEIPGFDPGGTYTYYNNSARQRIKNRNQFVTKTVTEHNKKIDSGKLLDEFMAAADDLEQNAWYEILPGDQRAALEDFFLLAAKRIQDEGKDLKSVLETRRWIDEQYKALKPKIHDGPARNGVDVAYNETRKILNDYLVSNLPTKAGIDVYDANQAQHHLIKALDQLNPKMNAEADNALKRTAIYLRQHALLPSTALSLALTAQFFAPAAPMAVTGGAIAGAAYATARFAASPEGKKALAGILKGLNAAIEVTKDPKALAQARADRAVLLDLMRQETQTDETE